ncbi:MAG TPA: hypothetical protein PK867_21595 [Pirellulales bacterium]|nr:hypothetical protein [Pirellulales bacterium]
MHIIDVITAREFFTASVPLPSLVFVGGSPEASTAGCELGVPANNVIAAYNCSLKGQFLSGAVFTPHELRISAALLKPHESRSASRKAAPLTIALEEIAEFRQGFEVAEVILRSGDRVRLYSALIPFTRLCVECRRDTGAALRRSSHTS